MNLKRCVLQAHFSVTGDVWRDVLFPPCANRADLILLEDYERIIRLLKSDDLDSDDREFLQQKKRKLMMIF